MTKSATINSRIEPSLKKEAEAIFATLGLSTSEAITMFYKQVSLRQGIPFDITIPNKATSDAIEELEAGKGQKYSSFDDLVNDL